MGIGQRLTQEMKPRWLRIGGYWYPRGGMPIDVFWQSGEPPEGLWLPDQGVRRTAAAARCSRVGARLQWCTAGWSAWPLSLVPKGAALGG